MTEIVFLASASDEADAATEWYFERDPDVAGRFRAELDAALARIASAPQRWPRSTSTSATRRVLLEVFPYAVHYRIDPTRVVVVAVAHQHRRPGYWWRRPQP